MIEPTVTIVIPCFNDEKFIGDTLKSIINQSYSFWEAIVVDDGSTDNSIDIVKSLVESDNRIKQINRSVNKKGASVCRNIGLKNASGKYLIFLDSDDYLGPDCLKTRVEVMDANKTFKLSVFQMQEVDYDGKTFGQLITKKSDNYNVSLMSFSLPWQTTGPIWQRDYLLQIGGFNDQLPLLEEVDLHLRAIYPLELGVDYQVYYERQPDAFYRVFPKNRNLLKVEQGMLRYLETSILLMKEKKELELNRSVLKGLLFMYWRYFNKSYKDKSLISRQSRLFSIKNVYKAFKKNRVIGFIDDVYFKLILLIIFTRLYDFVWLQNINIRIMRRCYKVQLDT